MKAMGLFLITAALLAWGQNGLTQPASLPPDIRVWREFVEMLRSAPLPDERIRPYQETLREPTRRFLALMRQQAKWDEWERNPEVFRVGQQVHFVLPLTFDEGTATYTFSFVLEGSRWYFQHLEAIQLRLDRVGPLPASEFPDVPEETKAWIRAEFDATRDVLFYKTLAAEKGAEAARKWFLDGAGYVLAARAWVPFVSVERAFILYACWEQSNLRGNRVVLESLENERAIIRVTALWFRLYDVSAHLRQQISLEDYRRLFEARWRDRAAHAGWSVDFVYAGHDVVLRFQRGESRSEARVSIPPADILRR